MTTTWAHEAERLDRALVTLGLARSRTHAAGLIEAGRVTVNERVAEKLSVKIRTGTTVSVRGTDWVSRAAQKLVDALGDGVVDPEGKLALDLGASTGGFTQVLLAYGARQVLALDVGHDQMAAEVKDDPRVIAVEGCNVRYLTHDELAALTGVQEAPAIVVADLSFISLTHVLEPIRNVAAPGADVLLLIKPQFEVGREHIGDGVVTDPALQERAVDGVLTAARALHFTVHGVRATSLTGTHGNQEFIAHLSAPQ